MEKYMEKVDKKDTGRLIPILVARDLESTDKLHGMMLRLTPLGKYTIDIIHTWLNTITPNWICGKEHSKTNKEHYHITLYTVHDEVEIRSMVNKFLNIQFPEPAGRGDANKRYNLTTAQDTEKAIQYSVKDADVTYGTGINPAFVESVKKKAFSKFSKVEFATELEAVKALFKIDDQLSMGDFMVKVVQLKSKYRQPINLGYIHQLAIACECERNPSYCERIVNDYLIKLARFN